MTYASYDFSSKSSKLLTNCSQFSTKKPSIWDYSSGMTYIKLGKFCWKLEGKILKTVDLVNETNLFLQKISLGSTWFEEGYENENPAPSFVSSKWTWNYSLYIYVYVKSTFWRWKYWFSFEISLTISSHDRSQYLLHFYCFTFSNMCIPYHSPIFISILFFTFFLSSPKPVLVSGHELILAWSHKF